MSNQLTQEYFHDVIREDGSVDLIALYRKIYVGETYLNEYAANRHLHFLHELNATRYIRSTQVALMIVASAYHFKRL